LSEGLGVELELERASGHYGLSPDCGHFRGAGSASLGACPEAGHPGVAAADISQRGREKNCDPSAAEAAVLAKRPAPSFLLG